MRSQAMLILRKLGAFTIDLVILNLLGRLLALAFASTFVAMGKLGFCVGVGLVVTYYLVFESLLGLSASPGKLLFGLKTSNSEGGRITALQSSLRSLVLVLPLVLFRYLAFWDNMSMFFLRSVIVALEGGLLFTQVLFPLFNGGLNLHDLISGTRVQRKARGDSQAATFNKSGIALIYGSGVALILAWCFVGPQVLTPRKGCASYDTAKLSPLVPSDPAIASEYVGCLFNKIVRGYDYPELYVHLEYLDNLSKCEGAAKEVAQRFHEAGVKLAPTDKFNVWCSYGFNIGIYSDSSDENHTMDATEFNAQRSAAAQSQ